MKIKQMPLGPLSTNCYFIWDKEEAVIIDPSGEAETIIQQIENTSIKPIAILLTHAHFDHIGAMEEVRKHFDLPVYIHRAEKEWLTNANLNGSALFGLEEVIAKPADHFIEEGLLKIGDFLIETRHTPGHSPGGVAYVFKEEGIVVGGDSLFAGGIGRTDLPGGNFEQLEESIKTKFYSLPGDYTVYPGHGPKTTIHEEKTNNPFVAG